MKASMSLITVAWRHNLPPTPVLLITLLKYILVWLCDTEVCALLTDTGEVYPLKNNNVITEALDKKSINFSGMLLWFNVHLISMAVYRGGGPEVCVLLLSALLEPLSSSVLFYTGENMQKSQWQVKSKISYDALGCISNQNKIYVLLVFEWSEALCSFTCQQLVLRCF